MAPPGLSPCGQEVRDGDHDRYLAALLAPPARRESLFALLAFNLELARIVESVREPTLGAIRLQWWREAIDALHRGTVRHHPVVAGLAPFVPLIPPMLIDRLIDAREFDLIDAPPDNLSALVEYAAETSGVLTEAMACMLRPDTTLPPTLRGACQEVGIAWSLIGIVRAVPFHAARGRVLLPADLMASKGLAPRALLDGRPDASLAAIVDVMLAEAERRLVAARQCRAPGFRAVLPALLPAALADLYLAAIRRAGCDPFKLPPRLPAYRLQLRLMRKALIGRF